MQSIDSIVKIVSLSMDPRIFATALFTILASYVVYQLFLSPLARVPGPLPAKLTSWYQVYLSLHHDAHRRVIKLHQVYGPVVRMGPNQLSIADPQVFREIYKAGGRFTKSATYDVMKGTRPFDLFGQRDEKIHGEQRKLVARSYTMGSMVHLEPYVDSVIHTTMNKLSEQSGFIDLGTWIQLFSFDVVGAISFSKPFGYVEEGNDHGIFARTQNTLASITWLSHVGWFYRLHQALLPIIGNWLAANDRNGYFFHFARGCLEENKGRARDSKDIMNQLFAVQKGKPQLNDTNITFMLTSNVFAGSDSTSTALRSIIWLLLKHPVYYNRMMKEMEERALDGRLGYPVRFQQAEAWPFLQAVVYEAMRLYPSVGQILYRDVPAGGLQCGDYWVPAGTSVGTSVWVIHRVAEVWGDDFEEFRPERWLGPEASNLKRHFFGFGGGSRTCIGKSVLSPPHALLNLKLITGIDISWLEMTKFLPTLLMRFHLELAPDANLTEHYKALVVLEGLNVRLSPQTNDIFMKLVDESPFS